MAKPNKTRRRKPQTNEAHSQQVEQYLARKGPQPGDDTAPTPERMAYAERVGESVRPVLERTNKGTPTGRVSWQIVPLLDELKRRKTIDDRDYNVALRYIRYYIGSKHSGPATARLLPRVDGEMQNMSVPERVIWCSEQVEGANRSVDPIFHPALGWLQTAAGDPLPLWRLGAWYYPQSPRQTQTKEGGSALRYACAMLARYFGMPNRFVVDEIEEAVSDFRFRITVEQRVTYEFS